MKYVNALRPVWCVAGIALCLAYVDRPLARAVAHLPALRLVPGTAILEPLRFVLVAAVLFLAFAGAWVVDRRPLAAWARLPLQCSEAAVLALMAAVILKFAIGRSQLALYVPGGVYAFRPFARDAAYAAFPSATMAVAAAILRVFWAHHPWARSVAVAMLIVLSVSIVLTAGHWLGDIVAGVCLGLFIGRKVVPWIRHDLPVTP